MSKLFGKTALVTGASRGIGRASALALAKAGAQVIVHYSTAVAEAEAVVAEITAAGGRASAIGVDLSAPDGAHKLAAQVRAIVGDRLDIVFATPACRRPRRSPTPRSPNSTACSPSTCAHPTSSCSNYCPCWARAAA